MAALSVVLPTYGGDDPAALEESLDSVVTQTRRPDELLVVRDGPVPAGNESVLDAYVSEYSFVQVVPFEQNRGRAVARKIGIEQCRGRFVAMMDADDICVPTRLERQESFLHENPDIDVVGAQLLEFDPETGDAINVRSLPTGHDEIRELAKRRAPVSQSTAMFRRNSVLKAGNYRDVARMEDYGLWARMLVDGAQFANLPEVLVKARAGDDMYQRRGGLEYALEEIRLQRNFIRVGFVSRRRALFNLLTRVPIRFVPNPIRAFVYEQLFRTNPSEASTGSGTLEQDQLRHRDN